MRLISASCPSCGAQLDVSMEAGKAQCPACGSLFLMDGETQHVSYDNAEDAGYRFELGRQRAQEEARQRGASGGNGAGYQNGEGRTQPRKRNTVLWILGWVLYFPIPLSVLVKRWYDGDPDVRIDAAYVVKSLFWFLFWLYGWVLVFPLPLFFLLRKRGASREEIKRTMIIASVVYVLLIGAVAASPSRKTKGGGASDEAATSEVVEVARDEEDAEETDDAEETTPDTEETAPAAGSILLEANKAGEYGRTITVYGGGSADDTGTRLGWFVPEGTYTVTNLDESAMWEQVNYGSPEPTLNSDGYNESTGFTAVLVKPHESVEIEIPPGGCLYIVGNSGRLELTAS